MDSAATDFSHRNGETLLARALGRARWSILWERLWPALVAVATAVGLFLAVSWFGIWLMLSPLGRAIGVGLFFLLTAAAFAPVLMVRVPSRTDGLRRLDRNSLMQHRPATTIQDELAADKQDSFAVSLWRAHIERALRAATTLRAGRPVPRLAARDPYALRGLVVVALIASFFIAGSDRMRRINAAFNWQGVIAPANFRIDAWVSPPNYTGKPPIVLAAMRPGEPVPQQSAGTTITVPAGSTLIIRGSGQVNLDVAMTGGIEEAKSTEKTAEKTGDKATVQPVALKASDRGGADERRLVISEAGTVTLRSAVASDIVWRFNAIPDHPPTIALTKDPEGQARGALQLTYKLEDDYGVVGAQANFKLKNGYKGTIGEPRSLFEAPDVSLVLPQPRTKNGVGQTTKDLTEHPWAGTDAVMTLTARDEAGNEGSSAPFELKLPERPFLKPVARSLIELRRTLALDGEAQARVLNALDALMYAPDQFNIESKIYLGLSSIYWQLRNAKTDDQLREVVARMWDMAVTLEDGSMSEAEAALRQAQEQLRQALERGATDEEIKRLTDQLRAALDKFLQALAEQARRNPQQLSRPLDPNQRQLRSQDLKNMIDRLEQMARNGAKDAARQLLQELQSMLDNLQMAQPGQMQDGDSDDDMMNQLNELGELIQRQQQLRDRTFEQGQDQRRQGQRQGQRGQQRGQQGQQGQQDQQGQQGQQGDQDGMGDLAQEQQALRDRLNKLIEELNKRGFGQQQGQQGQQGQQRGQQGQQGQQGQGQQLGQAGEAMGDAQGQLGQGNPDDAVGSQGRALDAL